MPPAYNSSQDGQNTYNPYKEEEEGEEKKKIPKKRMTTKRTTMKRMMTKRMIKRMTKEDEEERGEEVRRYTEKSVYRSGLFCQGRATPTTNKHILLHVALTLQSHDPQRILRPKH
jgi:hypothetical protein